MSKLCVELIYNQFIKICITKKWGGRQDETLQRKQVKYKEEQGMENWMHYKNQIEFHYFNIITTAILCFNHK